MSLGNLSGTLFVITFMLKRRKIAEIINALHDLDTMLKALGVEQNYPKYFKSLAIISGTMSFIASVVIYGTNIICAIGVDQFFTLWMSYFIITGSPIILIQYHGILVFLIAIDLMQKRYHQLNELFSNVCSDAGVVRTRNAWNVAPPGGGETRISINSAPGDHLKSLEMLIRIEELYNDLRESTDSVIQIFYPPIIGTLAFYFSTILEILYYIYVTATTFVYTNNDYKGIMIFISTCCWMSLALAGLFAVAITCSSIQKTVRISKFSNLVV